MLPPVHPGGHSSVWANRLRQQRMCVHVPSDGKWWRDCIGWSQPAAVCNKHSQLDLCQPYCPNRTHHVPDLCAFPATLASDNTTDDTVMESSLRIRRIDRVWGLGHWQHCNQRSESFWQFGTRSVLPHLSQSANDAGAHNMQQRVRHVASIVLREWIATGLQ